MNYRVVCYTLLSCVFLFQTAMAQEEEIETTVSVEESMVNLQKGLRGLWGNYEKRLSNRWTLRGEVGTDLGIYINFNPYFGKSGVVATPSLTVQPRWYYNLYKRDRKGKKTFGNSANFLLLGTTYRPDFILYSSYDFDVHVLNDLSFYLAWGMRRDLGKNFHFEWFVGPAYAFEVNNIPDNPHYSPWSGFDLYLGARVGYRF